MTTTAEKTQELKGQQKKRPIDIARDTLIALSNEVKDFVEDGTFPTINAAIMETMYKDGKHRTFNTYKGWQKIGKQVRKGEKAFLLWSKPVELGKKEVKPEEAEEVDVDVTTPEDEEAMKYYGIAYLFSNAQVEDIPQPEPEPEKVEAELLPDLIYD
ncbi:MAG TPA: ArdC-like ssDNA-binding domain-containing protein [Cytophagales bacterium]|nr:ArdC-like ssDNA-binding domain-containing protein [Cytophagales bacterium]